MPAFFHFRPGSKAPARFAWDSTGCACKPSRGRARVTGSSPSHRQLFRRNPVKLNELHKNQDFMGFLSARRAADGIGTSFQAIVDDVRCSLAREYLKDTRMNTSDITVLLGLSDGANFRRALKRWTGKTVNDLRR
ncbi:helix-turn-helix domain protein [Burkholderia multivorans]|uniref:Helix-turn-helix domain protein n=1 Tax=Burkholderia multivorans TaxID=87883 RepID=A0ABD7LK07_9BURK|nr:AraC family transcriptional regulator [Burkholderia multivorans]MDR8746623.1 hypothetical protein [Burkholderia multivorans]MDR8805540.1 hypothetical protein [Burkholderia multivorans]SAK19608.1 helix-turn-helix domain protein [Burkholderia multivorans]SAK22306.1 helix-turn-helix domain protein [Burkholderia multivorans]